MSTLAQGTLILISNLGLCLDLNTLKGSPNLCFCSTLV